MQALMHNQFGVVLTLLLTLMLFTIAPHAAKAAGLTSGNYNDSLSGPDVDHDYDVAYFDGDVFEAMIDDDAPYDDGIWLEDMTSEISVESAIAGAGRAQDPYRNNFLAETLPPGHPQRKDPMLEHWLTVKVKLSETAVRTLTVKHAVKLQLEGAIKKYVEASAKAGATVESSHTEEKQYTAGGEFLISHYVRAIDQDNKKIYKFASYVDLDPTKITGKIVLTDEEMDADALVASINVDAKKEVFSLFQFGFNLGASKSFEKKATHKFTVDAELNQVSSTGMRVLFDQCWQNERGTYHDNDANYQLKIRCANNALRISLAKVFQDATEIAAIQQGGFDFKLNTKELAGYQCALYCPTTVKGASWDRRGSNMDAYVVDPPANPRIYEDRYGKYEGQQSMKLVKTVPVLGTDVDTLLQECKVKVGEPYSKQNSTIQNLHDMAEASFQNTEFPLKDAFTGKCTVPTMEGNWKNWAGPFEHARFSLMVVDAHGWVRLNDTIRPEYIARPLTYADMAIIGATDGMTRKEACLRLTERGKLNVPHPWYTLWLSRWGERKAVFCPQPTSEVAPVRQCNAELTGSGGHRAGPFVDQ